MEGSHEDGNYLVRVRAQVMTRDDSTGGWVPMGAGGLSNVSVCKGSVSGEEDKIEYLICGRRITDHTVVLSCAIKKDFQYNKVMPTFHHWRTGDKKYGLTFQTAADAKTFDKGVRMAIEDLSDGTGDFPNFHDSDIGDDDVFMLADFLDGLKKRMCDTGDLDGIILTGLTNDGLSLIQRYVDTVGDVQTASLIILHSLPHKACSDSRAQAWVHCYRNLLDTWKLWKPRAMFDVNWFNSNPHAHKPKQQVYVSCNFCRRSVSYHLQQYHPPLMNNRFAQTPVNKKITCCPGCRKPMPRCSLCLSHMGTASGLNFLRETTNRVERKKVTDFSNWLTWCQTCRHGGHSAHILGWFQHHKECPVTGCSCKCMSLDAVANLKSLTIS